MPFLKLDCNWRAGWVGKMSEPGQVAWLCLLGYAKSLGHRGTVKAMDDEDYARTWALPLAAIEEMFDAAIANDSVTESNGYVTVTNWSDYQTDPTNADRQANHRAKKSAQTATNLPKNKRNQRNGYAPLSESNPLVTEVTQRGEERRREENNPPTPQEIQNSAASESPKGGVEPSAGETPAAPEPDPEEINRTRKGRPEVQLANPAIPKPWEAECREPRPGELESWLAELKSAKGAA